MSCGLGGWCAEFGSDDADSGFGGQFGAQVAPAFGPVVVLFGEHGADQADKVKAAGEDADDVGAAADFF